MGKAEVFDIFHKDNHTILSLKGNLPETPSDEFVQFVTDMISNPSNLVVNCFLTDILPEKWPDKLSVLHSLMPLYGKRVTFIHVPPNLRATFDTPGYENFLIFENILESLRLYNNLPSIPSKSSLIKAFVGSVIQTFYFKAQIPTIRKKSFIKNEKKDLFMGVKTAYMTVFGIDYFYNISISFSSDESFSETESSIIQSVGFKSEEAKIIELFNIFLEGAISFISSEDEMAFSEVKAQMEEPRPTEKIVFRSNVYHTYEEGINVVIPLTYRRGDFFIEVWIPDQFGPKVLSTFTGD